MKWPRALTGIRQSWHLYFLLDRKPKIPKGVILLGDRTGTQNTNVFINQLCGERGHGGMFQEDPEVLAYMLV